MNETLKEMKVKLHTVNDMEFKIWYDSYRLSMRKNANEGIDWPIEEMQLFHQIAHLRLICKAIRNAILNSPADFSHTFFSFFGDVRLAEMCDKKIEVTTLNLH